jgi:(p)ppGpp synthase/HD superfamily hydrolase
LDNAEEFLKKYNYADEVKEFLEQGKIEADMYNRFKDYYSYVFYIAKKKLIS